MTSNIKTIIKDGLVSKVVYDHSNIHKICYDGLSNHSDYWRSLEHDNSIDQISAEEMLDHCLSQVKEIVSTLDKELDIAYFQPGAAVSEDTALIHPSVALSALPIGKKIDIYCGSIFLHKFLKDKPDSSFEVYQSMIGKFNEDITLATKISIIIYLASEADSVHSYVLNNYPGYSRYLEELSSAFLDDQLSNILTQQFETGVVSGVALIAALTRELDSFSHSPVSYYYYNDVVAKLLSLFRDDANSSKDRLSIATKLVKRYSNALDKQWATSKWFKGSESVVHDNYLFVLKMLSATNINVQNEISLESDEESEALGGLSSYLLDKDIVTSPKVILNKEVEIYKETEAQAIYQADKQEAFELIGAIKESVQILNDRQNSWDEYSLRSGEVDEGALHKILDNSDDIFYQIQKMPKQDIQISILLDQSGSMAFPIFKNEDHLTDTSLKSVGKKDIVLRRINVARKLAVAFYEALNDVKGISLSIYGHAGPDPHCNVYQYISEELSEPSRLAHIHPKLHNYDGYAIEKVGDEMLSSECSFKRRLMFVISDGEPSIADYTGKKAKDHIKSVVSDLESKGIQVLTIGVDSEFPEDDGTYIYGEENFVSLDNFDLGETSMIIASFLEEVCKEII